MHVAITDDTGTRHYTTAGMQASRLALWCTAQDARKRVIILEDLTARVRP